MAIFWRDMMNHIEAEFAENADDLPLPIVLRNKLIVLDAYRVDYEKQLERAEREIVKIEFEALRIRKELGEK